MKLSLDNIDTPKKLMQSRYEAFVVADWNYIAQTSIHQTVEELSQTVNPTWLKLDILNAYEDTVEFKAYYKINGSIQVLHEKSTFIKQNNQWKYLDGKMFSEKVQKNETCPCGSGKKFKKCCS